MGGYDDREIVKTNLIESYDLLMEFAKKHLPDKFFLEDTDRISIRNVLAREMLGNTLMHREFSSAYTSKFVIETNRMYVENANRAVREGIITPDNLEPNPKNPIIASFFRNIGRADKLGSGVRNLFKYSKYYSGKEPEFIEGDIFRIIVPLDEAYSFDIGVDKVDLTDQTEKKADQTDRTELTKGESQLLEVNKNYPEITNEDISQELKWSVSKVKYYMKKLKKTGIIKRKGSSRKGSWDIFE